MSTTNYRASQCIADGLYTVRGGRVVLSDNADSIIENITTAPQLNTLDVTRRDMCSKILRDFCNLCDEDIERWLSPQWRVSNEDGRIILVSNATSSQVAVRLKYQRMDVLYAVGKEKQRTILPTLEEIREYGIASCDQLINFSKVYFHVFFCLFVRFYIVCMCVLRLNCVAASITVMMIQIHS